MKHMLQICCKNNNISKEFPIGSSLLDIYYGFNLNFPYQVVSAKVNNRSEGLNFRVYNNKDVEFLDIRDSSGMRTYVRSLCFILYKAVSELFPEGKLFVEHPVSKGYFCNLRIGRSIELEDVTAIKKRMQEIIAENIPYHRVECHTTEAVRIFSERGMNDKVKLLETSGSLYTYYYTLGDTVDYYYGNLLPSTGFIWLFDIVKYYDGLLLRIPNKENPNVLEEVVKQEKMLDVFKEHLRWNYIMGLSNVGDFNLACETGHATDLINVAEALQEKKIAQIADDIYHRGENGNRVKLVLISGPSSSGKTTFSKRLSVQLMTNGLRPYPISLDNYFVDREDTPRDENGNYDYESLYALDLELFNTQLQALLRGEEVELPRFNFNLGKKEYKGDKLRIDEHTILILEGIHALNPELTPQIPAASKYKIYVSALTTISLDDHPARHPQLHPHDRQPSAAPHHPRLQLPRLLGTRDHFTLAQCTCRRGQMDIPLPGKCRCHVQLRPLVRICRAPLPRRAHPYQCSTELSGIRRSLPVAEIHQIFHPRAGQRNSTDILIERIFRRQ